MTKDNEHEGPAAPADTPAGAEAAPSASSLEETVIRRPPPPPDDGLEVWTGPLPANRRRSKDKHDREAGPSEKHVYVPPVTLPQTSLPASVDQQKIMVAPSVLKVANERNQPTIRRIPPVVMNPGAVPADAAASPAEQTMKTGAQPAGAAPAAGLAQSANAQAAAAASQQRAATAAGKAASPWAKGGVPQVDKQALPSAQLLATAAASAATTQAPPRPERSRSLIGPVLLVLLAFAGTAGVVALLRWPEPRPDERTPIQVGAGTQTPRTLPPGTDDTADLPAPPVTSFAPMPQDTAAPGPTPPAQPPPTPQPTGAAAPDGPSTPQPTSAPRPPVTSRPPATGTKPTPPPTAKTAEPAQSTPPPEPPPSTTNTAAPPRPF